MSKRPASDAAVSDASRPRTAHTTDDDHSEPPSELQADTTGSSTATTANAAPNATNHFQLAYVTDVEGNLAYFERWVALNSALIFYDASGAQIVGPKEKSGDKKLGFDPCCVRHFSNGEYICVGGSDKKASLFTKDGVRLTAIAERDDWIW